MRSAEYNVQNPAYEEIMYNSIEEYNSENHLHVGSV